MNAPRKLSSETVFDALGSPIRRQIMRLLARGPMPVGAIATVLPVTRPAVSKHLKLLEQARLVRHDRNGTQNLFQLSPDGFRSARHWLDGFWDEALSRYADVADRLQRDGT
ncbi:MAG TPA: metalloregulator ArsR/SmtB family transcription factor [Polyangiaceae bacterium]|nr:metalloregulator ArsR/SmtB family transcription factor [Polyangiaceae bacterium]